MEAFDDEISNECIIDLLAKAYAARIHSSVWLNYNNDVKLKAAINEILERDIERAYKLENNNDDSYAFIREKVYKSIVGSDAVKERVEINKIARNIFDEELDADSQRYLQESLTQWKEKISIQLQEQYCGMFERWKQRFLDERDGAISQDEIDELRTDNKTACDDIDDICSEQARVVGELGKSMKEYMLEKEIRLLTKK